MPMLSHQRQGEEESGGNQTGQCTSNNYCRRTGWGQSNVVQARRGMEEYAPFLTTSATGILNHSELHKTTPCSHMTREKEEIP
ncbi:hypothetical protein AOLI_G00249970 [Acnodon oligacanthus]